MRVGRKEGIAIGRKKEDAKTILESRSAIKVLGMSPDIIGALEEEDSIIARKDIGPDSKNGITIVGDTYGRTKYRGKQIALRVES